MPADYAPRGSDRMRKLTGVGALRARLYAVVDLPTNWTGSFNPHPCKELLGGQHMCCRPRKDDQRAPVHLLGRESALNRVLVVDRSRRVRQEDDLEVSVHRVPGRGTAAVLSRYATDDDGVHSQATENELEIRRIERTEAVFLDHQLVGSRRDLGMDRCSGLTLAHGLAGRDSRNEPEQAPVAAHPGGGRARCRSLGSLARLDRRGRRHVADVVDGLLRCADRRSSPHVPLVRRCGQD